MLALGSQSNDELKGNVEAEGTQYSKEFSPELSLLFQMKLSQALAQIRSVQSTFPIALSGASELQRALTHLSDLNELLDPSFFSFKEAIVRARQAVAPITPPDFALHINDQTNDGQRELYVTERFVEAFKIVYFELVRADEYDWLHIDFFSEDGRLKLKSDPPLLPYLKTDEWAHRFAIEVLGLS